MTALIVALIILAAVCAWLVWRAWSRREQDAEAARGWDRAKAQEAADVEQAHVVEAAAVERIEADRDEALVLERDELVAEANRRARARYGIPAGSECSCGPVAGIPVLCACCGGCRGCACDGTRDAP